MIKNLRLPAILILLFYLATLAGPVLPAGAQDELFIDAEAAILADAATGQILFQKNPDVPLPPASMTKMMTEYLILEAIKKGKIKWDQTVPISDYAFTMSQDRTYSNVPLLKEGKYTVRQLFEAAGIYSANGAAIALAEMVGGTEGGFVRMMNDKGRALGMKNHKFVNSTGLNNSDLRGRHPEGTGVDEVNMFSSRDAATLAFRLVNDYPGVLEVSKIPKKDFPVEEGKSVKMDNWNWMLPTLVFAYEGMDGLKTGSTEAAGYSFTGTAKRGNIRLISVVMKSGSYNARFAETKKLLDYGFGSFEKKELIPSGFSLKGKEEFPVYKGVKKTAPFGAAQPLTLMVKKGEENQYKPDYRLKNWLFHEGQIRPPMAKGESIGWVTVSYKGKKPEFLTKEAQEKAEVPLAAKEKVKKASWVRLLFRSIINFFANLF